MQYPIKLYVYIYIYIYIYTFIPLVGPTPPAIRSLTACAKRSATCIPKCTAALHPKGHSVNAFEVT